MTRQRQLQTVQLAALIAMALLCLYGAHLGWLTSTARIQTLVNEAGWLAPVAFILLQIIQVVFPIIPGGLTTVAGVAIFGPAWGFVYNYIGIGIGSVAAFCLTRHYGRDFLGALVPQKFMTKYGRWLAGGKSFDRMFTIAILLPVAPDDFLCMLAGLTQMSLRRFVTIIVLAKPWTILAYSLGLSAVIHALG
ncbi:TVP38/TMEM64 family protein [Lacticaseibacillus nasuensis]|uniref:TVP38/TMEM64 family membrane protein n=1 Tax=Lacticaseibacillus nasuensis JCM 17158 TaxID=1291734 RepID=A0A0R1JZT3_9LACO|nr:TVP38/TMEM64 family protein [Lacticaseibacillus nasuensis]KRK72551.1 hypothetical protein FD02_GL001524 [Lacticaseibacillus nasuensis JCM 17158]